MRIPLAETPWAQPLLRAPPGSVAKDAAAFGGSPLQSRPPLHHHPLRPRRFRRMRSICILRLLMDAAPKTPQLWERRLCGAEDACRNAVPLHLKEWKREQGAEPTAAERVFWWHISLPSWRRTHRFLHRVTLPAVPNSEHPHSVRCTRMDRRSIPASAGKEWRKRPPIPRVTERTRIPTTRW